MRRFYMEDRKPKYKKPKYNRGDKRPVNKPEGDNVVYRTPDNGKKILENWQLKLKALSDCYDKKDEKDFEAIVEARYQELLHRIG